jgi:hypothetical protein
MSDDGSIVCVDKDGNPIVGSSDEERPTASLRNLTKNLLGTRHNNATVIVIDDDIDSSAETTLVIGTMGQKKSHEDVLFDTDDEEGEKNDGGSDESSVRPEEIEEGRKDGCESPVSLTSSLSNEVNEGMCDGSENPVRLTASAIAKNCERIARGQVFGPQVSDETFDNGSVVLEEPGKKKAGTNSSRDGVNSTSSLSKEALNNITMLEHTHKDTLIPRKPDRVDATPQDDVAPTRKRKNHRGGNLGRPSDCFLFENATQTDSALALHRGRPRSWYDGHGKRTGPEVASLPQRSKTVTPAAEPQVCEDSFSDEGILEESSEKNIEKNTCSEDESGSGAKYAEEMNVGDLLTSDAGERSISRDESNDSFTHYDVASLDDENPLKTAAPSRKRTTSSSLAESNDATSNDAKPFTYTTTFLEQQDYSVVWKNGLPTIPMFRLPIPPSNDRKPKKKKAPSQSKVRSKGSLPTEEKPSLPTAPTCLLTPWRPSVHGAHDESTATRASVVASTSGNTTGNSDRSAAEPQASEESFDKGLVVLESGEKNREQNNSRDDSSGDAPKNTSSPEISDRLDGATHNNVASLDDNHLKAVTPKRQVGRPRKHKPDETTKVTASNCVGSRVYAKWTNGQYFWGTITSISGDYYSVRHFVRGVRFCFPRSEYSQIIRFALMMEIV